MDGRRRQPGDCVISSFPSIAALLPHRAPAIVLDEVVESQPERVVCRATVRPSSRYLDGDRLPGLIAIEHMAQCIGVFYGLRSVARGEPIQIGLLLGCRDFALTQDSFALGDELLVEAVPVWEETKSGCFECRLSCGGKPVAHGKLTVFQGAEGL